MINRRGLTIILFLFLTMGVVPSAFPVDSSSANFDLTLAYIYGGGASSATPISSTNFNLPLSLVGEVPATSSDLSSETIVAETTVLRLLLAEPSEDLPLIGDLRAKTDSLGQSILESDWQTDNSPYFYWSVLTAPAELVTGFSFSLDTEPDDEADISATSYQYPVDGITDGKHVFYVAPYGNELWGEAIIFNIWVDTLSPVINSNLPAAGLVVSETEVDISCHITDSASGVDADKLSMSVNGGSVSAEYDTETNSFSYTAVSLPEGDNTILVKAEDNTGNASNKSWAFIIDTVGPLGAILLNSGDEVAHSPYVIIDLGAEDDTTEVTKVYISNDGVFDDELSLPCEFSTQIKDWPVKDPDKDGLKTVYVIFEDAAGNRSEIYSDSISLKLLTPDTRIVSAPPSVTQDSSAAFIYEASKPGCVFSFRLDDGAWSVWSAAAQTTFSGLAEGNHYFLVKAAFDLNADEEITSDEEDATPSQWIWSIGEEGAVEEGEETLFWKRQ